MSVIETICCCELALQLRTADVRVLSWLQQRIAEGSYLVLWAYVLPMRWQCDLLLASFWMQYLLQEAAGEGLKGFHTAWMGQIWDGDFIAPSF